MRELSGAHDVKRLNGDAHELPGDDSVECHASPAFHERRQRVATVFPRLVEKKTLPWGLILGKPVMGSGSGHW